MIVELFWGKCKFYNTCPLVDKTSMTCKDRGSAEDYCGHYKEMIKSEWKKQKK